MAGVNGSLVRETGILTEAVFITCEHSDVEPVIIVVSADFDDFSKTRLGDSRADVAVAIGLNLDDVANMPLSLVRASPVPDDADNLAEFTNDIVSIRK